MSNYSSKDPVHGFFPEDQFEDQKKFTEGDANFLNSINLYHREWIYILCTLDRIGCPSNNSSKHAIDEVPNEVKDKFQDLKEVAEGDAKPEREATSQGVEHASVL